jgi:hypothetical protein
MKRTALARKTPIKAKTPLKPGGKLKPRSTTKRTLGKPDPRWRSRAYLGWVKTLPCVISGLPADEAHHLKGVGSMSGTGLTAPDWAAMPVTREQHDLIHQSPDLWPQQWEFIARTLGRAIEDGVLILASARQ